MSSAYAELKITNNSNNKVIISQLDTPTAVLDVGSHLMVDNNDSITIKDKFNPERYCVIDKSAVASSDITGSPYNSRPSSDRPPYGLDKFPKQVNLFSCSFEGGNSIVVNPPTAPRVTGYVEVTDDTQTEYRDYFGIADYTYKSSSGDTKTFFDIAVIFAAVFNDKKNIASGAQNYCINSSGSDSCVVINPKVKQALSQNLQTKDNLRNLGIPTLLAITGDSDNSGWGCFAAETDASAMAAQIVAMANDYRLDGIVVDAEYSKCDLSESAYIQSIYWVVKNIKNHSDWHGRILNMVIPPERAASDEVLNKEFLDDGNKVYLRDYLDFISEMTYGNMNYAGRLNIENVKKNKMQLGEKHQSGVNLSDKDYQEIVAVSKNYGGMMIFDVVGKKSKYVDSGFLDFISNLIRFYE